MFINWGAMHKEKKNDKTGCNFNFGHECISIYKYVLVHVFTGKWNLRDSLDLFNAWKIYKNKSRYQEDILKKSSLHDPLNVM